MTYCEHCGQPVDASAVKTVDRVDYVAHYHPTCYRKARREQSPRTLNRRARRRRRTRPELITIT